MSKMIDGVPVTSLKRISVAQFAKRLSLSPSSEVGLFILLEELERIDGEKLLSNIGGRAPKVDVECAVMALIKLIRALGPLERAVVDDDERGEWTVES